MVMKPSIKDVAAASGLSLATVSRALTDNGLVNEQTRQKVLAAAEALGYRPNLQARRLRSKQSQTIGLIVADIRNPFFTAVSRAIEDAAYREGIRVLLCNSDEDPAKEAMYLRLMQEEQVGGVIFSPTLSAGAAIAGTTFDFPLITIDRALGDADCVALNNHEALDKLVDHLVANGYRRIGGLFGNTSATGQARHDAYVSAMHRHGLTPDARRLVPTMDAAQQLVGDWLDAGDAPEALIASNGLTLLGAMRAIRQRGLRIPDDIALAGIDNEAWTELVEPALTVIGQPTYDIGDTAMRMLMNRIHEPALSRRVVALSGELIVRDSTRPRTA
ncbi:LacI family transcriptional regulator [Jeongeupia chitinilytica]|uniref:LacI family transcriptional regulator n=2 Tax=Jeongeupia chitinilytica TaxID=1041641 RepID=A0ABQ3GX30_9NEIS|nr:LacI family transcriptional regulator [Jeongeupia chitinilytica]